jgi:hypothetical protein
VATIRAERAEAAKVAVERVATPPAAADGGSALAEGPGEFDIDFETSPDFFTAMSGPKPV